MTTVVGIPLTRTADRARAAALVTGAVKCPIGEAFAVLETVDALSAAVLRIAGLNDTTIRAVLAALWTHPVQSGPAAEPARRLSLTDREREFLRDLGERIHLLRRARRLDTAWIRRSTGIPTDQLADTERGVGVPTALALYRLADALQVPLPLLLDTAKSPLDILRELAARQQP
jgi:hypothetical protein